MKYILLTTFLIIYVEGFSQNLNCFTKQEIMSNSTFWSYTRNNDVQNCSTDYDFINYGDNINNSNQAPFSFSFYNPDHNDPYFNNIDILNGADYGLRIGYASILFNIQDSEKNSSKFKIENLTNNSILKFDYKYSFSSRFNTSISPYFTMTLKDGSTVIEEICIESNPNSPDYQTLDGGIHTRYINSNWESQEFNLCGLENPELVIQTAAASASNSPSYSYLYFTNLCVENNIVCDCYINSNSLENNVDNNNDGLFINHSWEEVDNADYYVIEFVANQYSIDHLENEFQQDYSIGDVYFTIEVEEPFYQYEYGNFTQQYFSMPRTYEWRIRANCSENFTTNKFFSLCDLANVDVFCSDN